MIEKNDELIEFAKKNFLDLSTLDSNLNYDDSILKKLSLNKKYEFDKIITNLKNQKFISDNSSLINDFLNNGYVLENNCLHKRDVNIIPNIVIYLSKIHIFENDELYENFGYIVKDFSISINHNKALTIYCNGKHPHIDSQGRLCFPYIEMENFNFNYIDLKIITSLRTITPVSSYMDILDKVKIIELLENVEVS